MNSLTEIAELLRRETNCVLSTHVSPDPDAIGSCFALAQILSSLGIKVSVWLQDPLPEKFALWIGEIPWTTIVDDTRWSAFIAVDTASRPRVGREVERLISQSERSYNIDHHVSNDGWAEINYIDGKAPACAQIIWQLAKLLTASAANSAELGSVVNASVARLLYGGLADDTGRFCFSNTTPESFITAAEMVGSGAKPHEVAQQLYFSQPLHVLRLQGVALSALKILCSGRIALITITSEDLKSTGATSEDTEGLVDIARSIDGVEAAVFLRQLTDGWKVSLRSKVDWLDVNAIAGTFGGGGHRAAAGCRVDGSREQAESAVIAKVEAAILSKGR